MQILAFFPLDPSDGDIRPDFFFPPFSFFGGHRGEAAAGLAFLGVASGLDLLAGFERFPSGTSFPRR